MRRGAKGFHKGTSISRFGEWGKGPTFFNILLLFISTLLAVGLHGFLNWKYCASVFNIDKKTKRTIEK